MSEENSNSAGGRGTKRRYETQAKKWRGGRKGGYKGYKGGKRKKTSEDVPAYKRLSRVSQRPEGATGERMGKKTKVALLFAYDGTSYAGLQLQDTGVDTVESELIKAFVAAGCVSADNAVDLHKFGYARASRTDKGVHAAGQVIAMKMVNAFCSHLPGTPMPEEGLVDEPVDGVVSPKVADLNRFLPSNIRVFGIAKVTGGFNPKNACGSRRYEYLLPSFVFGPPGSGKEYRLSEERLAEVKEVFQGYVGTRAYHNFTSGIPAGHASANRHIRSFEPSEGTPVVVDGWEWLAMQVHGDSFVIHMIRKMIGTAIALLQGYGPSDMPLVKALQTVCLSPRIAVAMPMAPGNGLILHTVDYSNYGRLQEGQKMAWPDWVKAGVTEETTGDFRKNTLWPIVMSSETSPPEGTLGPMDDWMHYLFRTRGTALTKALAQAMAPNPAPTPVAQEGGEEKKEEEEKSKGEGGDLASDKMEVVDKEAEEVEKKKEDGDAPAPEQVIEDKTEAAAPAN